MSAVCYSRPCVSNPKPVKSAVEEESVKSEQQHSSTTTSVCASRPHSIQCIEYLFDDADARYDKAAAQSILIIVGKSFPKTSHAYNYYMARGYEILSRSTDAATNSRTRANETFAVQSLHYVEKALKRDAQHADSHRIFSEMLGRRIYGASTGIQYDAVSLSALDRALTLEPENPRARLRKAINLLQRPPRYGGDPDQAIRMINRLNRETPQNSRVIYFIGEYYRSVGNTTQYRVYLQLAVATNPKELPAVWALREYNLQQRQMRIEKISVKNPVRTSEKLIQQRLQPLVGEVYTAETKQQIEAALTAIPPVDGVSFYYSETSDGLQIALQVDEDNMKLFHLALGLNISLDTNRDVNWFYGDAPSAIFGSFYYETNNFLGSGDSFSLASAAVYNDLRYQHFTRILDSRLQFAANVFPLEKVWYRNGERIGREPYQYIWLKGEIGLGKSFELGELFLMQAVNKAFFVKTHDYFLTPKESFTATTYLLAALSTIAYHDTYWVMDGIRLELKPEMILKPGYAQWGYVDEPLDHNKRPMFKLMGSVGLYKSLLKSVQFREDIFYLYSANPYLLEQFALGKDAVIDPFSMKLRGFYQEEFVTSHALVVNSLVSVPVFTQKFRMGLFYDCALLFETLYEKKTQYKHGTGIQFLLKLPWHLEFVAQGSVGLNAKRQRGPGMEMDFYLSRLFVR